MERRGRGRGCGRAAHRRRATASRTRWRVAFAEAGDPSCARASAASTASRSATGSARRRRRSSAGCCWASSSPRSSSASSVCSSWRPRWRAIPTTSRPRFVGGFTVCWTDGRAATLRALPAGPRSGGGGGRRDRRAVDQDRARDAARGGASRRRRVQRRARRAARGLDRDGAARAARRGAGRPAARAVSRVGGRPTCRRSTTSCATPARRASRCPARARRSSAWSPATPTSSRTSLRVEVAERAADAVRALGDSPRAGGAAHRPRRSPAPLGRLLAIARNARCGEDSWYRLRSGRPTCARRGDRRPRMPRRAHSRRAPASTECAACRTEDQPPLTAPQYGQHRPTTSRHVWPGLPLRRRGLRATGGLPAYGPQCRRRPRRQPIGARVGVVACRHHRRAGAHRRALGPAIARGRGRIARARRSATRIAVIPIDGAIAGIGLGAGVVTPEELPRHARPRRGRLERQGRSCCASTRPAEPSPPARRSPTYVKEAEQAGRRVGRRRGRVRRLHGLVAGRQDRRACPARRSAASA